MIYRLLLEENPGESSPKVFQRAMSYLIALMTTLLWICRRGIYLPFVPELKVLSVLRSVHDEAGHWAKQGTLAKLQGFADSPSQSTDVEQYILGCFECARHDPATTSHRLHPVRVQRPFQLLGIDLIAKLPFPSKASRSSSTSSTIYPGSLLPFLQKPHIRLMC